MIEKLLEYLKDKKIAILGLGREGKSTYHFLRKHFPDKVIAIHDENEKVKQEDSIEDSNVTWVLGENYLANLNAYDLIIKAPGISFKNQDITDFQEKITSQLELFLSFIPVFTIGITGTKGKSTTSSLLYQMLCDQNKEAILIGNIGRPAFEELEQLKPQEIVVIEMSSHQLEYMDVSPNIGIILNVFEEHLDHYASFRDYAKAKYHIGQFQKKEDSFLYNADNETLKNLQKEIPLFSKVYEISLNGEKSKKNVSVYRQDGKIFLDNKVIYEESNPRKLVGDHNLNDIMFVLGVSEILHLDLKRTTETIANFNPLPHRMELVGTYDDVIYYNDSIATIPEATMDAIDSLKKVSTLIIGGMDRNIDYTKFIAYLNRSKIDCLICLPDTGWKIKEEINNPKMQAYEVRTMEEAVTLAKEKTRKKHICLLSPAAASYGFFKNFEERGNCYKEWVRK